MDEKNPVAIGSSRWPYGPARYRRRNGLCPARRFVAGGWKIAETPAAWRGLWHVCGNGKRPVFPVRKRHHVGSAEGENHQLEPPPAGLLAQHDPGRRAAAFPGGRRRLQLWFVDGDLDRFRPKNTQITETAFRIEISGSHFSNNENHDDCCCRSDLQWRRLDSVVGLRKKRAALRQLPKSRRAKTQIVFAG